jgi:hypothetical protein
VTIEPQRVRRPGLRLSPVTLVAIASGALVAGHLLPVLDGTFIEFGMRDALHVVVFAVFGLAAFQYLARFGLPAAIAATLLIIVVVGATAELIQSTRGTEPNLTDVYRDLAGGMLGIIVALTWRGAQTAGLPSRRQALLRAGTVAAVVSVFVPLGFWIAVALLNYYSAPRLVSFDHWWERHVVWEVNTTVERVAAPGEVPLVSGRVAQFRLSPDRRSGISVFPGFSDWRHHQYLAFTIAVLRGPDVDLRLRLNDGAHFRRYDGAFTHRLTATTEPVRLRLPLAELARDPTAGTLDLSDIRQLTLTASRAPADTLVLLDDFQLE